MDLHKVSGPCPVEECDFDVAQISANREHALGVVNRAVDAHLAAVHPWWPDGRLFTDNEQDHPSPMELYKLANGDKQRYHDLLVEHGHLVKAKPEESSEVVRPSR